MKKNKLNLDKFRIAKLNNPKSIFGEGDDGDNATNTEENEKKTMITTIIIKEE